MPDDTATRLAKARKTSLAALIRQYLTAFVPGYEVFAELLSSRLGVDSDKILAITGFWFAGWASFTYLKNTVIPKIATSFTSTLTVKAHDYGHASLREWLQTHGALNRSRLVWASGFAPVPDNGGRTAQTPTALPVAHPPVQSQDVTGELFNYAKAKANRPIEYTPESGLYFFVHRWRPCLVLWSRIDDANSFERGTLFFKLYTLGNSTKPLENILQEAVKEKLDSRLSETTVWRASGSQWSNSVQRGARPLSTISLDPSLKAELVIDLNTYLQPGRSDWYAARGVPYRRGYLFWGPPGCGKTSLAFSLAGSFGLDVYIANLTNGYGINEDDLQFLVNDLPDRCVLVIEDIDAVAVDREKAKHDAAFRNKTKDERQPYISLSGLLNALDGMFAKDGRLLVMTTNFREYLDAAILRPGRVDKQIKFDLMTRTQIADIFVRMFGSTGTDRAPPSSVADAIAPFQPDVSYEGCPYKTADELRAAGKTFAEKFPEKTFSPAALQEYLISSFEDPQQAIDGAEAWIERELTRLKEKEEREAKELKDMVEGSDSDGGSASASDKDKAAVDDEADVKNDTGTDTSAGKAEKAPEDTIASDEKAAASQEGKTDESKEKTSVQANGHLTEEEKAAVSAAEAQ